jgi:hypothetical protein
MFALFTSPLLLEKVVSGVDWQIGEVLYSSPLFHELWQWAYYLGILSLQVCGNNSTLFIDVAFSPAIVACTVI